MSDEPVFKKLVKGFLMKRSSDPDEQAGQILQSMPMDMLEKLRENRHDAPLVKRMVVGWATEQHAKVDTRVIRAITEQLTAGRDAWTAYEEAVRAKHKAMNLPDTLQREDDLARTEHQTKMLEHLARQGTLTPNPLRQQLEEEKLRADIDEQRARRAEFGGDDITRQVKEAVGQIRNKSDFEEKLADALRQFGSHLSEYDRQRIAAILRNELG